MGPGSPVSSLLLVALALDLPKLGRKIAFAGPLAGTAQASNGTVANRVIQLLAITTILARSRHPF